ncbi:CCR4-Not complex component, Not1-domain-containing protein [Sporodiniella umbellata]|nr:CCR4-Not complex component, Not1-domain-containing protein [Sporodiniella umbellata]
MTDNRDAEHSEGRVCKLVLEGGYECCNSISQIQELLSTVPNITEKEVAETIGCMARTHTNMTGVGSTTNEPTWNIDNFVLAVTEKNPTLDWAHVFQELDYEHFFLYDSKGLDILVAAWRCNKGEEHFPIGLFFGQWKNLKGQLSALYQMVNVPIDAIDIPSCSKRKVIETVDFTGSSAANRALAAQLVKEQLNSLDLIECIIKLANTAVVDDVKVFLEMMINKSPELVFMGLLQIDPIANKIHEDLFARLIVYYFTGNPSSVFVFTKFWESKPELFRKNIVELYSNDFTALARILAFVHELKILPEIVNHRPFIFAIDLAALASRLDYMNLETWIYEKVKEHGATFCTACLALLGTKLEDELSRKELQSTPSTIPMPMEVVNVLVNALAESKNLLGTKELQMFNKIQSEYSILGQNGTNSAGVDTARKAPTTNEPVMAFKKDIETEANSYYERIYSGDLTIEELIEKLRSLNQSKNPREKDIYSCMIHNLLDEYKFFDKYPEKELAITSILFGQLIQHRLFSYASLGVALRHVLDALTDEHVPKLYRFGLSALAQFQSRLPEWPQYCFHLTQIPALQLTNPEIVSLAKSAIQIGRLQGQKASQPSTMEGQVPIHLPSASTSTNVSHEKLKLNASAQLAVFTAISIPKISKEKNKEAVYENPNEATQDKILFIINNLAHNNLEDKMADLKSILKQTAYSWFSNYLVVKRASIEPNYHTLYLLLLSSIGSKLLYQHVLKETLSNIKILLNSENTVSSSTERSLLKNLGAWLGGMTLAQNKPIKQKYIALKELLLEGYDTSRLIVIIPFVCKVLEQGKRNTVFVPPNPWLMAVLKLLVELYQNADLKLNLKFEIEVLCKTLAIELSSIEPTATLKKRKPKKQQVPTTAVVPKVESSFSVSRPPITNLIPPSPAGLEKVEEDLLNLPNLGSYLIFNPQVAMYTSQSSSKRWVLQAVKQAIFEVISPVVERSVAIASVSTRELILKDFATESDENKMRKAAHMMARSLAGSLAMVTCKEPLRGSMTNHMISIFVNNGLNETAAEHAASITATDNLELICAVIEKTAMEKVIAEVDEILMSAYANRKKHREQQRGSPYFDMDVFSLSRYPASLPEPLRPKPNGLHANQLRVYEDFLYVSRMSPQSGQPIDPSSFELQHSMRSAVSSNTAHPELHSSYHGNSASLIEQQQASAHQILERFAQCISELEKLINTTHVPTFSVLPLQHDIVTLVNQIPLLAMSSFDKAEAARTFAQKVVQLLYKSEVQLGREVYVILLERLCEVSPNVGALVTSWLTHADDERKYNVPVTVALIKAHLINLPEQDQELASLIDSGRVSAIDFTARLIRACLLEESSIAARQEFAASFEALSRLRGNVPDSVMALIDEMHRRSKLSNTPSANLQFYSRASQDVPDEEMAIRDQMHVLFSEWIRLYQHPTSTDKMLKAFVTQLSQQNIFKMEDMTSLFYRTCIEASVEHVIKHRQMPSQPVGLVYLPIDALSKLIVSLMELPQPPAEKSNTESADNIRVALLTKFLTHIISVMSKLHDQHQQQFDQRPFLRLFTSLLCELHSSEQVLQAVHMPIFNTLSQAFDALQPTQFQGFTFAWVQLISHRLFMPKLLLAENQKGWPIFHRLLMFLFKFIGPFLQKVQLKETTRTLYRGTLRVLLVLLHDFPEFLCAYHYSFCDVIPSSCIQLRNLVLSAFPRHMRLPDPFTPNLKVDLLPDIHQAPDVLSDYTTILKTYNLKQEIDEFMKSQGSDKNSFLTSLPSKLLSVQDTKYNTSVIHAVVFYTGAAGIAEGIPVNQGPPLQLFQHLLSELDTEGRYLFLSAIANQLRYPNSHTHYFSCVILFMFAESSKEIIKEQITRVLLERLIVNRPHPWGLLITFIELIKNPRYSFWTHSFTQCAKDIERLFESVSRSISQT